MIDPEWWRTAVVYQCYPRSFADGDGDGVGDLAGLRSRIPHLARLGVDAVWVNPWYPSPQHDAGYDVADFRDIDPAYGTLADADALVAELHAAGIRLLLDLVPNHVSHEHPWFRAALAGDPAMRARFHFRPGRGASGELPPNDWTSLFGGPAWTRTTGADGVPGEWYLHLFAPEQPDLAWDHPAVGDEFDDVLRFWFDRGVDGFRVDVAHGLVKADGLPDAGGTTALSEPHPAFDQDGVHAVYRRWRRIADEYAAPRVFVAEAWVPSNERLAHYVREDELHTAFQFDLLLAPFRADVLREVIDDARAALAGTGSPTTWVLSNHDVVRHVTRYGRAQPERSFADGIMERQRRGEPVDLEVGRRRARAAALLTLALPGTTYVYQGDELGLPEVEDIPDDRRLDPRFHNSGGADVGRDGCRVPLPWQGEEPPYGFGPGAAAATWLPQPKGWGPLTVAAQEHDDASTLTLYRRAIALRRQWWVDAPDLAWVPAPEGVLAFRRGDLACWLNTSGASVALPGPVLLHSAADAGEALPPDTAAWVRLPDTEDRSGRSS
ncbi:glycoside hydrolase family 13 protein [Nocardioides panacisoli]|uniref:glycoside hydrolase family 13 protein n=1 Tax=Nocardioides panacisoli TaxID=627624 RepID=UPI001C625C46|nr:alpha-amylase family glycosyl hydrolase [Nocardioides panacisoli]QYJ02617.1 glycoside hydrolase family 13 protein [Nocardioides panacisoli]